MVLLELYYRKMNNTGKKELDDMIRTGKVNRNYIGISGIEINESVSERYGLISENGCW